MMIKETIELSPDIKNGFEKLIKRMTIDKATKLRTIYLFEEFINKLKLSRKEIHKENYSLYLCLCTYVATRSMTFQDKSGNEISGPMTNLTSFFDKENHEAVKVELIIESLQEIIDLLVLDHAIKVDLVRILSRMTFFNKLYRKFNRIFEKLELSAHLIRHDKLYNLTSLYKKSLWMLFGIFHSELLRDSVQVVSSLVLIADLFWRLLKGSDIISNFLITKNQENKLSGEKIMMALCELFGFKSKDILVSMDRRVEERFNELITTKMIIRNSWNSCKHIIETTKNLETYYQQLLTLDDIDLRFYFNDSTPSLSQEKTIPIQKQGLFYDKLITKNSNYSKRVLDFDNFNEKTASQKSEVPKTKINFDKMIQSPYQMKSVVPVTPMTCALNLYNWMYSKIDKVVINTEDYSIFPSNEFLLTIFEALGSQIRQMIFNNYLLSTIGNFVKESINNKTNISEDEYYKLFEERRNSVIRLFIYNLEEFVKREMKTKAQSLHETLQKHVLYKTLLVQTLETISFVLGLTNLSFQALLRVCDLEIVEFYYSNLTIINYEENLQYSLKNHFLDLEKFIINRLLWEDKTMEQVSEIERKLLIEERISIYVTSVLQLFSKNLNIDEKTVEKTWSFFKIIYKDSVWVFVSRFVDQILMCCLYSVCKISRINLKFQEIINVYQRNGSFFTKSLFNSVIFECSLEDGEIVDIITFYNRMFINDFKAIIYTFGDEIEQSKNDQLEFNDLRESVKERRKKMSSESELFIEKHIDTSEIKNLMNGRSVINSPFRELVSTPFTYYNKSNTLTEGNRVMHNDTINFKGVNFPISSNRVLDFSKIPDSKDLFVKSKKQMSPDNFEQLFRNNYEMTKNQSKPSLSKYQ